MKEYPDHIVVAGGGRWARVLTSVLCGMLPESSLITVYSPRCATLMRQWVKEENLFDRVVCSSEWPLFLPGKSHAMIVANAARDHFSIVKRSLESHVPVLVEKPVAITFHDVQCLALISQDRGVFLAPAHVFLFASYLKDFSELVSGSGEISGIKLYWSDPVGESRYGESKTFDSSIPIYADLMPHVLSILNALIPVSLTACDEVVLLAGGRHLNIDLSVDGVKCEVELIRNDVSRRRVLEVETEVETFRLDFSQEPGLVFRSSDVSLAGVVNGWGPSGRPVAKMLDAFLSSVVSDELNDSRLDLGLSLHASKLSSQIKDKYDELQCKWFKNAVTRVRIADKDIQYAVAEVLQRQGRVSVDSLTMMQKSIRSAFSGAESSMWLERFAEVNDCATFLHELASRERDDAKIKGR